VENVVDSKLRVLNKRLQNTERWLLQLTSITAVMTLKHLNCVTVCVLCQFADLLTALRNKDNA
jgi:hypothetical protein